MGYESKRIFHERQDCYPSKAFIIIAGDLMAMVRGLPKVNNLVGIFPDITK
jgi:hypothetical protein